MSNKHESGNKRTHPNLEKLQTHSVHINQPLHLSLNPLQHNSKLELHSGKVAKPQKGYEADDYVPDPVLTGSGDGVQTRGSDTPLYNYPFRHFNNFSFETYHYEGWRCVVRHASTTVDVASTHDNNVLFHEDENPLKI